MYMFFIIIDLSFHPISTGFVQQFQQFLFAAASNDNLAELSKSLLAGSAPKPLIYQRRRCGYWWYSDTSWHEESRNLEKILVLGRMKKTRTQDQFTREHLFPKQTQCSKFRRFWSWWPLSIFHFHCSLRAQCTQYQKPPWPQTAHYALITEWRFFIFHTPVIVDDHGIILQPQSETLIFRGLGAEPSNKLLARGITGALLAGVIPNKLLSRRIEQNKTL